MLWNWYTIDSCFIARSWHIRSSGMFAGSCIGVILLVISLEFLRRAQRELDRYFRRTNAIAASPSTAAITTAEAGSSASSGSGKAMNASSAAAGVSGRNLAGRVAPLRWWQQLVRSFLFMVQFAVGYFVMLLAMYYNGEWFSILHPLRGRNECTRRVHASQKRLSPHRHAQLGRKTNNSASYFCCASCAGTFRIGWAVAWDVFLCIGVRLEADGLLFLQATSSSASSLEPSSERLASNGTRTTAVPSKLWNSTPPSQSIGYADGLLRQRPRDARFVLQLT